MFLLRIIEPKWVQSLKDLTPSSITLDKHISDVNFLFSSKSLKSILPNPATVLAAPPAAIPAAPHSIASSNTYFVTHFPASYYTTGLSIASPPP
jgi:hypothetical protein